MPAPILPSPIRQGNVNGQDRLAGYYAQQKLAGIPFAQARNMALLTAQGGTPGAGRQAPNVGQQMTITPFQQTGQQYTGPALGNANGSGPRGLGQAIFPSAASPATPSLLSGFGGGGPISQGPITQGPVLNPAQVLARQNQLRATPAPLPMNDASAGGALSQVLRDLVGQQGERSAIDFGLQASADNARQAFAAQQAGRKSRLGRGQLAASDAISRLGDQGRVMSILLSLIGDLFPSGGLMNIPQAQFNMPQLNLAGGQGAN